MHHNIRQPALPRRRASPRRYRPDALEPQKREIELHHGRRFFPGREITPSCPLCQVLAVALERREREVDQPGGRRQADRLGEQRFLCKPLRRFHVFGAEVAVRV